MEAEKLCHVKSLHRRKGRRRVVGLGERRLDGSYARARHEQGQAPSSVPGRGVKVKVKVSQRHRGFIPHAYTEDAHCSVVVDGVAAVRTYFSMPGKGKAKNVLLVRFTGATEETRRLFVATAATMSLLGSGSFKMSETPDGDFYVCTTRERDAALLDGQLYSGFGVQVAYHRVSRIEMEPRIVAMGDDAAFKLFDRDC